MVKVKMLADPMRPLKVSSKSINLSDIHGEFGETFRGLGATDLLEPLLFDEKERLLESIDARLPDDYLQFVSVTEGAKVGSWRIYGLSEVRRIVQRTANFYLLAEAVDGRAIGVIQESQDQQLYLLDPEDDTTEEIRSPLLAYLKNDLAKSTKEDISY